MDFFHEFGLIKASKLKRKFEATNLKIELTPSNAILTVELAPNHRYDPLEPQFCLKFVDN